MFLLRFKVSGHSMMPILKPGQEILVSSLPYLLRKPRVGDIVAFKKKDLFIVKRIKKVIDSRLQVTGDNTSDSKDYGWIGRSEILGKVIYIHA
jgi:signal peptidase I